MGKSDTYGALLKAWINFNFEFLTNYVSVGITFLVIMCILGSWIFNRGKQAGKKELKVELAKAKSKED